MNIKQEINQIRGLVHKAYTQISILSTIIIDPDGPDPHFSTELDKLVKILETTVMRARSLNEACYIEIQPMEKKSMDFERHWSKQLGGGKVEVDENGWLHITLDTLLPNCKRGSNPWLRDTLTRLLLGFKQSGGEFPRFERAMLIIDEHCDIESRRVFDQDNKAWKVIPNVLKGLVIEDDDQFSLGVALISTWDSTPACHIHVMALEDAGTYFSLYLGDSGSYFCR